MKTTKHLALLAGLAVGLFGSIVCRAADSPNTNPAVQADAPKPTPPDVAPPPGDQPLGATAAPQPIAEQPGATNAVPDSAMDATNTVTLPNGETGFMMNFRGVPLERVLDYLSSAAGFIVHPEVPVRGTVTVWSNQPLSTNDAVKVLEQALTKNGFVLLREGRMLNITTREKGGRENAPIMYSTDPDSVPRTAEFVTQIIPVHSLNAVQLVKDLAPFMPTDTTMQPNDAGNSLIITDTQATIRRVMEIIRVLDSVSASINTLQVIPLKYADAKAVAADISTIFPSQNTGNGPGGFGRFRGGGGGGGGGPFGGFNPFGGNNNNASDGSTGHTPTTRVSATSDDHSNSLIVSAPEDLMTLITNMVAALDQPVDATTEVRVFRLKNADPTEMTSILTGLFPDENSSTDASRSGPQLNGFRNPIANFFAGGRGQQGASTETSDRMKVLGRVIAVADPRTASVVVTAAKDVMPEIAQVVEELDSNPARKMKVFSVAIENADPADVLTQLQTLFPSTSSTASRSGVNGTSGTTVNPLLTRQTQAAQNTGTSSSAFSGSAFGASNTGGRSGIP
jgi:type II secretory pathway component GspD/PulD (secretin)